MTFDPEIKLKLAVNKLLDGLETGQLSVQEASQAAKSIQVILNHLDKGDWQNARKSLDLAKQYFQ